MPSKSTKVVSTKISKAEYEFLLARTKALYKLKLIKNCTVSCHLKGLIDRDLANSRNLQDQNLRLADCPNVTSGLSGIQSRNPPVLPSINPETVKRIADSIRTILNGSVHHGG
jgi:hypothetical protein